MAASPSMLMFEDLRLQSKFWRCKDVATSFIDLKTYNSTFLLCFHLAFWCAAIFFYELVKRMIIIIIITIDC